MTTALYRRYRPETFADVIGQEHVTEPLMQALRTGRVGHAYLFSGPRGCGKTTSARILARCLNCEQGPTPTPCGTCDSCVALARGGPGSVDVIEIDAASHGGVDDARDLRERAAYGPAQSRFKVYIIDEAHMVTPQGFNALLKIVEEPPEHVKFVFATTEPEKVIGTIRSRTHHYPFRLVPPAKLTAYLERLCEQERVTVAPGVLGFVTRAGGGSVRDSLSVLDQLIAGSGDEGLTYEGAASLLGFTGVELLDATIDALAARDAAGVFAQVDKVVESGHDPRRFAMDLLERLRDLIIVAAIPDGAASVLRGVPEDQLDRMRGQQARFGPGALSRAADIVNAGVTEMTGATAPRLQLELICARILLPAASGESGYAARLDRLERRFELGAGPASPAMPTMTPERKRSPAAPPVGTPAPAGTPPPATAAPAAPSPDATGASAAPQAPAGPAAVPASMPPTQPAQTSPSASSGPATGHVDVAAVRRVWPEVLGRVFHMRRATWTFLSSHAQVLDYDGDRLVLGIATVGLTQTFRQGNHAELVRQALIEEIGLDARVEGVPMPEESGAGGAAAPGPPSPAPAPPTPAPASDRAVPSSDAAPARFEAAGPPAGNPERAPAAPPVDPPEPPFVADTPRADPAHADPGHASALAPPARPSAAPAVRAELARAKEATRRSLDDRHHAAEGSGPRSADARHTASGPPRGSAAPEDEVSRDDEDVEGAEAGQAVVERLLGARVVREIED